ncbi:Fic family protein [Desulfonatronum thioautotrophicum]|uniref:Fic family protein n=1 Tax=Desulfonatronum thioautotrophicum TaxID=617001 RepID=UPI0005EB4E82|nr:Fic family protein [Desulfonatronum thioautotrophicum]
MTLDTIRNRPAGYAFLIEQYGLSALPNWHTSSVSPTGTLRSIVQDWRVESVYPQPYWPGDATGDHLEFALKYDGVNLGLLSALFEVVPTDETAAWISSKPTGKYARRIWFLYEFLTGRELPLSNLSKGNYIELLEPDRYYTVTPGRRVQRQRIIDNLLGGRKFCPIVRRTDKLAAMEGVDLRKRCEEVVTSYPPELLRRALSYLYNKETKSSFEIEHIKPSASRAEKFIGLLEMAEGRDFCEKHLLIDVQNRIVDPRFRNTDYRTNQNFVGQTFSHQRQLVHYACPKPDDLPELMEGLLKAHQTMTQGAVPASIHAAAVSYGFVLMHPFEDGNGRIHRFLIHNILFLRGVIPKGLMFPVSAAMLKNRARYDHSLEAFSKPLMRLVEYDLDDLGEMTVPGETGRLYRYIDMTAQAEALYDFIMLTIERELVEELDFLVSYDKTRQAIQEIVDMPDRLIDLFIQLCLQNNGRLSAKKRESHFDFLTDDELAGMEHAVRQGYVGE